MNQVEKQCVISIFQARYSHGGKKEKGQILDEVCERLRVGRRQARRLLEKRPPGRPRKPETRGRPRKYGDPEFTRALRGLWKTTRYMRSRHLKAAIPYWIVPVEQEKGSYAPEIRQLLLSVNVGIGGGALKSAIPCDFMMSLIECSS
jgi:hypothetical protein